MRTLTVRDSPIHSYGNPSLNDRHQPTPLPTPKPGDETYRNAFDCAKWETLTRPAAVFQHRVNSASLRTSSLWLCSRSGMAEGYMHRMDMSAVLLAHRGRLKVRE